MRQNKYTDLLPFYNTIAYMEGPARLTKDGVAVNGGVVRTNKVIITTGASPAVPPIAGIGDVPYLMSTSALELEQLPDSLLVIGGGYIGCELAQMFARANVRVTIVCRRCLLPEAEPEISEALTGYFRDEGITVFDGVTYQDIRAMAEGVGLSIAVDGGHETVEAEKVLLAAGRWAITEGLGLAEVGVELTEGGGVKVDDYMRTTNPAVYAAGDVTGQDMFVYMAG